jgi:hypothetical protein
MFCNIIAMPSATTICSGTTTATRIRVFFRAMPKLRSPSILLMYWPLQTPSGVLKAMSAVSASGQTNSTSRKTTLGAISR